MARPRWKPKETGGPVAMPAERGRVDVLDDEKIFIQGKDLTVEKVENIQRKYFKKGEAMMMLENNGIIIQPLSGGFEDLADIAADIKDDLGNHYHIPPRLLKFHHPAL